MNITITIPDDIALVLGSAPQEREQRARETIALEPLRLSRTSHEAFPNASPVTPPLPTDKNA